MSAYWYSAGQIWWTSPPPPPPLGCSPLTCRGEGGIILYFNLRQSRAASWWTAPCGLAHTGPLFRACIPRWVPVPAGGFQIYTKARWHRRSTRIWRVNEDVVILSQQLKRGPPGVWSPEHAARETPPAAGEERMSQKNTFFSFFFRGGGVYGWYVKLFVLSTHLVIHKSKSTPPPLPHTHTHWKTSTFSEPDFFFSEQKRWIVLLKW